jgi:hypothetical protein
MEWDNQFCQKLLRSGLRFAQKIDIDIDIIRNVLKLVEKVFDIESDNQTSPINYLILYQCVDTWFISCISAIRIISEPMVRNKLQ